MLSLKHYLLTLISICMIALIVGIITIADDTPSPIIIETSYGQTITITDEAKAHREWNTHETNLENTKSRMGGKVSEKDAIDHAINGDEDGIRSLIVNIGSTILSGKKPKIGISTVFADELIKKMNDVPTYDLELDLIDKWSDIDKLNGEIADAFSDRNAFHSALAEFEGFERPYQVKDSLSDMQQDIPPMGAECSGNCGDWYFDIRYWGYYAMFLPHGIPSDISLITINARSHERWCKGCDDKYHWCNEKQRKDHQLQYCGKPIEYWMYDSLSGKSVWSSVGICGASYRNCDDPTKKITHRYMGVSAYGLDSQGNYGSYQTGYKAAIATTHGQGTTAAPSVSIHGVNGVGVSENRIDQTPNCTKCVDGSRFCPNASTKHSRVPQTPNTEPESNPTPQSNPDPQSPNPSPNTEPDPFSNWTYCVKCTELYLPVYNTYDGSCSQGGYHKDSY